MSDNDTKVYTIKLVTGDELVTRIKSSTEHAYILEMPLVVIPTEQGVQLIRALFTAKPNTEITLNKSACAMIAQSRDDISMSYIESTTGIKPVVNKILMG